MNESRRHEGSSLLENMKWGAIQGLGIGLVFTAWVTFLRIVRGTKPFEVNHTTFAAVLALYLVGGPFAGAIVGLFRPISKRLPGAILAGAVGGIPAGIAVRLALFGFSPISEDDLWFLAAFSLWAGPLAGYVFWRNSRREDRHLRSQRRQ